ncbi:eukaryotic mitochondrial regulator protein-domain-containing protein [Xylariales sp. PMI_506]|nr:eukaryotic mitochondrial regulator protein-domain-containing protein [Xylariales sp. PMI_506]
MTPRLHNFSLASSASCLFHNAPAALNVSRQSAPHQVINSFSTTACQSSTSAARRQFRKWLNTRGREYKNPSPDSKPNYISAFRAKNAPFPLNPEFKSSPVLSDGARELIWKKVMQQGETIKAVSAELGVDITRVAAVVRLKEVEKDWISKGQKLAIPYAMAMRTMVPTRDLWPGQQNEPLEDINELHVHPATMKQLYWPTSESRHFTREDAAKAFDHRMLSADKRVPHPELIQMEKDLLEGKSAWEAKARFTEAAAESERKAAQVQMQKALQAQKDTTKINTARFEFRFQQINAEDVGSDGRKLTAIGARYGRPSYDRAKGAVKIPTSVP